MEIATSTSSIPPKPQTQTEERLLRAAGAVFAEVGYRAATIREICEKAGVNIAAVNYHFGDKEGLYLAVVRYAFADANHRYPMRNSASQSLSAEERLYQFIRVFFQRIFAQGEPTWHGKLMAREMVEPTVAMEFIVEQAIRPNFNVLSEIIFQILGPTATHEDVKLCGASVIGQCLHYRHAQPVIRQLFPEQRFEPGDVEQLARHITNFSLTALRHYLPTVKTANESSR